MPRARKAASLFRYFNLSLENIRLVVMMYVPFPLSLCNVENLFFDRGIDICRETMQLLECSSSVCLARIISNGRNDGNPSDSVAQLIDEGRSATH